MIKKAGYISILFSLSILVYVIYDNYIKGVTRPFSAYSILASSWNQYKKEFINEDGRINDEVMNILKDTAEDLNPITDPPTTGLDIYFGYGLVDAEAAVVR